MTSYSGLRLEPVAALGVNFLESGTIRWNASRQFFYPVGSHISHYHLETNQTQFLFPDRFSSSCSEVIKICDVAVTGNGQFIAISEVYRPKHGILSIYDTETQVAHAHMRQDNVSKFISIAFSSDSSMIAAIGIGNNENKVYVWKLGRQVNLAVAIPVNQAITSISFDPQDHYRMVFFSKESVSSILINTVDLQKKSIDIPTASQYDLYSFVPSIAGMLLVVSNDQLFVLMNETIVQQCHPVGGQINLLRCVRNIVFLISGNMIYFFKASNAEPYLTLLGPLNLSINSISEFSPSPDGDLAILLYNGSYSGVLDITVAMKSIKQQQENQESEKLSLNPDQEDEINEFLKTQSNFEGTNNLVDASEMNQYTGLFIPLPIRCHIGPIVTIATCPRKPLLATCGGQDRTLLVWNLAKRTVIASEHLSEPVNSLSFHPSGDLLAVGTSEKLLLYSLTFDALVLRAKWESLSCTCVSFSNGGHLLAAGSLIIKVISTYSAKTVTSLRGHNSSVKSISWAPNDAYFVSSGIDGNVFSWPARTWDRKCLVSLQIPCIGALLCPSSVGEEATNSLSHNIIIATSNNTIYDLDLKTERQPKRRLNFTSFCLPVNFSLITGDTRGNLQVIPFPLLPAGEDNPFHIGLEVAVHTSNVNCILSSSDGQTLFTASDDSSIFIFNIVQPHQMVIAAPISMALSREEQSFLIERETFDEKKEMLSRLREMLNLHRSQFQCAKTKLVETHSREIAQQKNKWQMTLCSLKKQVHALMNQKTEQEKKAADIIAESDAQHIMKIRTVKELYEQQLTEQTKLAAKLMKEKVKIQCENEERLLNSTEMFKEKLLERRRAAEKQLKTQGLDNDEEKKRLLQIVALQPKEEQILRNEHEMEMESLRKYYLDKINKINQEIENVRTELVGKQDEYDSNVEQMASYTAKISRLKAENDDLTIRKEKMKEEIENIKKDLNMRGDRVARQTNELLGLKSLNDELLKWRTVLDSRMNAMNDEVEPKGKECDILRKQISQNEATLRAMKLSNSKDAETLERMESEINTLYDEILKTENVAQKCDATINQFKNKVHTIYTEVSETKWPDEVRLLHDQFSTQAKLEKVDFALVETLEEFNRHKSALADRVVTLRNQVEEESEASSSKYLKHINQNEDLIAELAKLRKENRNLKSDLHFVQTDLNSHLRQCALESKSLETKMRSMFKSTNVIIQPSQAIQKKTTRAGTSMYIEHFN